jgi:hypothetical protein
MGATRSEGVYAKVNTEKCRAGGSSQKIVILSEAKGLGICFEKPCQGSFTALGMTTGP